jgi:hypothetical protein
MKTIIGFALGFVALAALAALPVYPQHGHGGGAHSGMGSARSSDSSDSSDSSHGNSADAKRGNNNSSSSISEKLSDNTKLADKLQGLLPSGTNLQTAAQGFKNLGQFVAAVHASHNLDIPFDQLKAKMMGPPKESLGKAIDQLRPDANSKTETKKAHDQAKQDMQDMNDSEKSL